MLFNHELSVQATMKMSRACCYYHIWKLTFLLLILFQTSFGLNTDGTLLLSFKYSVLSDPLSVLENWDYNDVNPCGWTGVSCGQVEDSFGNPDPYRVIGLNLPNSKLLGSIPEDLGLIPHLRTLDLSANFLNGSLPATLFNASELQALSLAGNSISGGFSGSVTGMKRLKLLNLSDNALAGEIPKEITGLVNLTTVSLRSNYFSGEVPASFRHVEFLDLSSNLLNGLLPENFGGENLRYLNLSFNRISGILSPEFAKNFPANTTVDLSFNNLTGEIPKSSALNNQKTEFFAGNSDLCGKPLKKLCTIPSTLSNPPNISMNSSSPAIAAIPKTISGTSSVPVTSGGAEQAQNHRLKPWALAGIVAGDLAGLGLLALLFLYIYQSKKKRKNTNQINRAQKEQKQSKPKEISVMVKEPKNLPIWPCLRNGGETETSETTCSESSDGDEDENKETYRENRRTEEEGAKQMARKQKQRNLVMIDGETELDLETLLKASAYVLGSSGGGSIVYKAVLENGTAFAVRRIGEGGTKKMKEFEQQVKAVAKLRHPNLVRVRGFYWGDDEKLVICDYVSNGSLANVGFRRVSSSPYHLPFDVRVKIAKGIAKGISYIHEKKHVHGNIKPSNILLTQQMEPIISDFGLHWLLYGKSNTDTSSTSSSSSKTDTRHFGSRRTTSYGGDSPYIAPPGFIGCTSAYHAPESLKDLKPSPKWDVYSYGVVLLELLTGKMFSDRELGQWTGSGSVWENKDRVLRMADVAIRGDVEGREEATLALFKLGFDCVALDPKKRPSMKDVANVLDSVAFSSYNSLLQL